MGNIKDLMGMIPGVSKAMKDVEIDDDAFKPVEAIIKSMTKKERANPDLLDASRKRRLAKGSGTDIQQVNALMKQFDQMRQMMRQMNKMSQTKGGMAQMQKMMGGMGKGGPGGMMR